MCGIAACFVVAMALTAFVTGIEKDDDAEMEFPGEDDVDRDPPDNIRDIIDEGDELRRGFTGAVVAMFIIKTIGMVVAIMFAAADMVQFLGMVDYEIPETKLNKFLDTLGSDIGVKKLIPIFLSVACNIVFHDYFIEKYLDKNKSSWELVGLEFLYFTFETLDNYAGLCLGNVSQNLYDVSPVFSIILALMFGQIYNSNLWVVTKSYLSVLCLYSNSMRNGGAGKCGALLGSIMSTTTLIPGILG